MDKVELEKVFENNRQRFLDEWTEFLRFESISTDPAYNKNCLECAAWLSDHLKKIGMESKLLETPSKPVVFAEFKGKPGRPVISFYGHYDVQPADPLEKWQSKPFEPELRDGRMYARGAQDNKGQVFYLLKAVETLIAQNSLECTLKVFIEGEEESGSGGISAKLEDWKDLLKSDVFMVCDTGCIEPNLPTITMGLRGIVMLTAKLKGPRHDLHSGVHGGVIKNPATEIARLVASLHREDGSIAVPGFYDSVLPIEAEDRKLANMATIEDAKYEAMVGVPPLGGEKNVSFAERRGFRPALEINGIAGGYSGAGTKTIIPSEAIAKISARLAADQDPAESLQQIIDHLKSKAPAGLNLEISETEIGGKAVRLSANSPVIRQAAEALRQIVDRDPVFMWEGASIPVVSSLAAVSGAEPLLVGFGWEEDNIHSPNESFSVEQLRQGFLYAGLLLSAFSAESN